MCLSRAVAERCSFTVYLAARHGAQPPDFAASRLEATLRPMLNAASDVFIYNGLKADSPLLNSDSFHAVAIKHRGKYQLRLDSELIDGFESLWLATGWGRGSAVFLIPAESFLTASLLAGWGSMGITWNYRVAHNTGAVTFAKKQVEQHGCVAVCLPASNGIEWADLFAPRSIAVRLWQEATGVLPVLN